MRALLAVLLVLISGIWMQSIHAETPLCTEVGLFSYSDLCREYYECRLRPRSGELVLKPRSCKEGKFFDDSIRKCTREDLVVSPPRCVRTAETVVGDTAYETPETSDYMDYEEARNDTGNSTSLRGGDVIEAEVQNSSMVLASNATQNGTETFDPPLNEDQVSNETYSHYEEGEAVDIDDAGIAAQTELTFCDHIKRMEEYASLVIGTPNLHESFKYKQHFHEIFDEYNNNLEGAKNNTFLWRHGESIVVGLKNSYQKAREYESEFVRKLEVNKKQISVLSSKETDQKYIQRIKDDIKSLTNTIKGAEEALKFADVPQVRVYFEGVINSSKQEIKRKSQEMKLHTKEGKLLGEMISFLGYVKNDAQEIADLGNRWYDQMDILSHSLKDDAEIFAKYTNRTNENISEVTKEYEDLKEKLDNITVSLEDKENRKGALNDGVLHLTEENYQISQRNMELVRAIQRKYDIYDRKVKALCQSESLMEDIVDEKYNITGSCNVTLQSRDGNHMNVTLKEGDISDACNRTLHLLNEDYRNGALTKDFSDGCRAILHANNVSLDISAEEARLSENRMESAINRQKISSKLNETGTILEELRSLHAEVPVTKQKMKEIEFKLSNLQTHARDLRNIEEGVKIAIDSLDIIKSEFQLLENTFGPLANEFQNEIENANAAESEDDKHHQRKNIENMIDNTLQKLKDLQLPNMDDCN